MRSLLVMLALGIGLASAAAEAAPPSSGEGVAPGRRSARGSEIRFWGWSPDSQWVAYTRLRTGRTRPDQRMHRLVAGGRFEGFGKMVGGDVERYARERGYVVVPAAKSRRDERHIAFVQGTRTLTLSLEIGRAQAWRLTAAEGILGQHVFDRIYVGFDAELFAAPDARQAVLVMHLDTGWEIDAAIFPVSLDAD